MMRHRCQKFLVHTLLPRVLEHAKDHNRVQSPHLAPHTAPQAFFAENQGPMPGEFDSNEVQLLTSHRESIA